MENKKIIILILVLIISSFLFGCVNKAGNGVIVRFSNGETANCKTYTEFIQGATFMDCNTGYRYENQINFAILKRE